MAKTFDLRGLSTPVIRQRRSSLLKQMRVPTSAVRASCVEQFLTCGKKNCRCLRGQKHGPFYYLVQCMAAGAIRKFLLKTPAQHRQARARIAAYVRFQEQMEELSQINTELLRRGES